MKIDWYKHYTETKKLSYNKEYFEKNLKWDKPYIKLIKEYIKPKGRILEVGCGPARTAISIAYKKFEITAVDNDKKMLEMAKENSKIAEVNINFKLMNMFDVNKKFEKDFFDCVAHQGVLEHFKKRKIIRAIKKQLYISPFIIFSVPLNTKFNHKYFRDNIYRNLWSKKKWIRDILKDFKIIENKQVRQRSDNLLIVIKRGDKNKLSSNIETLKN